MNRQHSPAAVRRAPLGFLAAALALTACAAPQRAAQAPAPAAEAPAASPSEAGIRIESPGGDAPKVAALRARALRDAALGRGSRMGYARRAWEIRQDLRRRAAELDREFAFERVVADAPAGAGYIVPPVVARALDAFRMDGGATQASVADEYLSIAAPGRLAPAAPSWRDYLLFEAPKAETAPASPAPADAHERSLFSEWLEEGWRAGAAAADGERHRRLARLRRDYGGMLQYRRLVALGMMDRIVVRDADFGVTGGGGEMRVGSRTVRIVSEAEFSADPSRWRGGADMAAARGGAAGAEAAP